MAFLRIVPAVLAAASLVAVRAAAAEPDATAVDSLVAAALEAWRVPGASLVVVRGERTVALAGYGVKRLGRPGPVGPDTAFPLASCTKAFTAALAGTMVDDGTIGWDDLVQKHLPGFRLSDPNADAMVSLRDLLCHRTGVRGHDLLWYRAPWNLTESLARAEKLPLEYPFRGGFEYSTIMYAAAGRALAATAGQPWEALVRERLVGPLGMAGVTFAAPAATADRATGHLRDRAGAVAAMPEYAVREPNPAGSMYATARDLAAWLKFQLAGGTVGGKRLISAASLKETRMPQNVIRLEGLARRMNPDTHALSYGLGWVVSDHRGKLVVAHGGVLDGFRAHVAFLPEEGIGFALLNNLHETRMNQALANSLIDLFCGLPRRDWNAFFRKIAVDEEAEKALALRARDKARNPDRKPSYPPAAYAGTYEDAAYGTATVAFERRQLILCWSSFRCPLEHWDGDTFRITEGYFADKLVEFGGGDGKGAEWLRFVGRDFSRKAGE